jgi:hypothetical protein
MRFFAKNTAGLCKKYNNIGFKSKTKFFRRKLAKIAKNCDHNIDPIVFANKWLHRLKNRPMASKSPKIMPDLTLNNLFCYEV